MKNLIRLVCILLLFIHLPTFKNQVFAGQEGNSEQPIELSQQLIEREIGKNQSHYYYVNLQENQFLFLDVVQLGIDIKIVFQGENVNFEANTPYLLYEPEPLYWVTKKTGKYTIVVKAPEENPRVGKYSIKIGEIRASTDQDIYYIKAQEKLIEAEKFRVKGDSEAFLSAINSYKVSAEEWERVQQKERQAVCLGLVGETYYSLENMNEAKIFVKKSLNLFPIGSGLAQAFCNLGHIDYAIGNIEEALKGFLEGLKVNKAVNDNNVKVNGLNGLGALYYSQLNRKDEAYAAYNEVIKVSREMNNSLEEGTGLYNSATICRDLGQHEKALSFLDEALAAFDKGNAPLGHKITVLNEVGINLLFLKKFDLAAKNYDSVIDLATKNKLNGVKIRAFIAKGYNEYVQGDYQKSLVTYQEALTLNEVVKGLSYESVILRQIGLIHFLLGDNEKALVTYEKGYDLAEKVKLDDHKAWIFYRKAEVYKSMGQLDLAIKNIEKTIELVENIRGKTLNTEFKTFQLVEGNNFYEFYIDLLMTLHEKEPNQGYDRKAVYIYELSKARAFLDLVNESGINIRQGVSKELIDKELQFQILVNQKNNNLRNAKSEEEKATLTKELNLLNLDLQQVQVEIKKNSVSYSQAEKIGSLSLEEIQSRILDDDTLLIEYLLGKLNSYVWVVSNKSINSYKLPSKSEIEKLSRPVATYFKTRFKTEDESEANKKERLAQEQFLVRSLTSFSEIILGQITKHLTKKKLIFVANGALQEIPFAALLKPDVKSDGELYPLIMEHEIIILPSASTLGALKEKSTQDNLPTKSILIVADPVLTLNDDRLASNSTKTIETAKTYNTKGKINDALVTRVFERGNFKRLTFASQEAKEIISIYSNDNPKVLLGLDSNLSNVTNPEVSEYAILHFITHGFIDQLNPELSGIVLSLYDENRKERDGYLTTNNIFNLRLKADLIVLSACETGLGKEIKAEGILGLSRGFFHAGAKRVLFTLWNIDDESTSIFMSKFYSGMKKDKLNPSAALRQAQIFMWKSEKWKSPYFWAPFQLQGNF
jgi:CHAT domain-containing protein/tetratricopeptide (TPR) repeat protein